MSGTRLAPALLALAVVAMVPAAPAAAEAGSDVEQLVFLLQYVGADYGAAVRDGQIANAFEYGEMVTFSRRLVSSIDFLRERGAPEEVGPGLRRLEQLIQTRGSWEEVRSLAEGLATALLDTVGVAAQPATSPDLARGARLYVTLCATCHGVAGGGDGPAASGQDPAPTSFRDPRMNLLSPHHVFSATRFGIEGTGMASFGEVLSPAQAWDVAFHVMTLRGDFAPAPARPKVDLTLRDLATTSNEALLARLGAEKVPLDAAGLDYVRAHPPASGPEQTTPDVPAERPALAAASPADPEPALRLQEAFAAVADRVIPGVVNVTAWLRDERETAVAVEGGSWAVAGSMAPTYPGFRRLKSGSGFFVSADGYVLTCHHAVVRDDGTPADAIDVEVGGRRVLSRLVGAEPTLDLAVLQLEVVPEHRPMEVTTIPVGDAYALRVGHWTIAVGDPGGPERTFAVGTLAAQADRQCYQEQLSATLLQTSLHVHPESYGGPLVDIRGRVVGMLVPPPAPARSGAPTATEYALPIELALNLYEALRVAETRRSPWLGVSVLELATARRRAREGGVERPVLSSTGVFIDDVFDPGPASRAGVRVGDTLTAIDGNRLLSVLDFQKWLYLAGIGREVILDVYRGGKTVQRRATIEERPPTATTR